MLKLKENTTDFIKEQINVDREVDLILDAILHHNHYIEVERAATLKDGVFKMSATQKLRFRNKFNKRAKKYTYTDFIPASGSGSRFLKLLIDFSLKYDPDKESLSHYINRTGSYNLNLLFHHLKDLPFYESIKDRLNEINLSDNSVNSKRHLIVQYLLASKDLKFKEKPVALFSVHTDNGTIKTFLDEHLELNRMFGRFFDKNCFHLTISHQYKSLFEKKISEVEEITSDKISFSIQNPEIDVYAIDENQNLVQDLDSNYVRFPSGHGSLIKNLNHIDTDIVQISAVNDVPNGHNKKVYLNHRRLMLGYLIFVVEKIHSFLHKLENDKLNSKQQKKLHKFLKKYFHLNLAQVFEESNEGSMSTIYHLLNVPIRIATVLPTKSDHVSNPYWSKNSKGISSLQIIENNEIDFNDENQKFIATKSTHYNPINMFIYLKDYKGNKFDLESYASNDNSTVVSRSYHDKQIKLVEQAGLWNGKMKDHLTVFLQAESNVYNPVRELTDLFNDNHISND